VTTTITVPADAISLPGKIKYRVVPESAVPAPPSGASVIVFDIDLLQDSAVIPPYHGIRTTRPDLEWFAQAF
jgi:hypothetical protein